VLRTLLFASLVGCSFSPSRATGGDDVPVVDAPSDADAPVTEQDANTCFGTGLVKICLAQLPTTAVTLPIANPLNTGVDSNCTEVIAQTDGDPLCVIEGTQIDVGNLVAIGTRPLVLVATGTITVSGALDVSSTGTRVGAGANFSLCADAPYAPTQAEGDSGGGGGGAGGGFGTVGGSGALGDDNDNHLPTPHKGLPGLGGAQQPAPTVLRGGCPGSAGGSGTVTTTDPGGAGGAGGGAVYLISRTSIAITGTGAVFASGAGGQSHIGAAGVEEGGGGGGSGGMIGIDAPAIAIDGILAANGGAGAGGGGNVGGSAGGDGSTVLFDQPATAGIGDLAGSAGNGEAGTSKSSASHTTPSTVDAGGGGGSGGLGVVWIDGAVSGGTNVSPAPTAH